MTNTIHTTLYRKQGKKYIPVGMEFNGTPLSGIWIIQNEPGMKSQRFMCRVGEVPDAVKLAQMEHHRILMGNVIADYMFNHPRPASYSANDVVTAIFKAICETEASLAYKIEQHKRNHELWLAGRGSSGSPVPTSTDSTSETPEVSAELWW